MALRPVIADRLALALLAAQKVNQRAAKQETKDQRRGKGHARAEGDIAKQVKDVAAVRKLGQPIQHYASPCAAAAGCPNLRKASTMSDTLMPFDPLTKMMSPASIKWRARGTSSAAVATQSPR